MTVLETADQMRRDAIALMLAERQNVDTMLAVLGWKEGETVTTTQKEKKARLCKTCNQPGHNARSCSITPSVSP